jgi:hypothetical protein
MMRLVALLVALHFPAFVHAANPPEPAGRVQFVTGSVVISARDRAPRHARKGEAVNVGDVITTDAGGSVQLAMRDGAMLSLRPGTRLQIESYHAGEAGTGEKILALARGGLRALSARLKQLGLGVQVRTPAVVIGVRGTDHEVIHIPEPLAGEQPPGPPGSYDRVYEGGTFMRSRIGSLDIEPNQVGFAPNADTMPVLLDTIPPFMSVRHMAPPAPRMMPAPGDTPHHKPGPGTQPPAVMEPSPQFNPDPHLPYAPPPVPGSDGVNSPILNPLSPPPEPNQPFPPTTEGGKPVAELGDVRSAPLGAAGVAADIYYDPFSGNYTAGSGGLVAGTASGNDILVDPNLDVAAFNHASGFHYGRYDAPLVDSGGAIVDGIPVKWGVYQGGVRFDPVLGQDVPLFMSFAFAPDATSPLAMQTIGGNPTFGTIVGFTQPTAENGLIGGSVTSFSTTIDFGGLQLLNWSIGLTDANARIWGGSYTGGPISINPDGVFNGPMTAVNCSPCAGASNGNFSVIVVGPNGGGVISSYNMTHGTASVAGTVVAQ